MASGAYSSKIRTYIQTSPENHPIKVSPVDVTDSFMRQPKEGSRFYTIIPGAHGQALMTASSIERSDKEEIKGHFTSFLSKIENSGCKNDFLIGIEARFGRRYYELSGKDFEKKQPCSVADFEPNLLTHNSKTFYTEVHHDIRPILDKYCAQDRKKEAKMMTLDFKLAMDKQTYTALIKEVSHGEFELKAVLYKPKDKTKTIGPERHDIVLPGRKYDIGIAHNSGPSMLSATESLSYKAAEAVIKSMERKRPDTNELTLILAGEVSDGKDKSKYQVNFVRYKVQTQYPWKGNGRLVLAKFDVKQHKIQESEVHKAGSNRYDICFHPKKECREELELWGEKIFPKDVDQTKPDRSDYLYMQSCVIPLRLEGEDEPIPRHPWQTAEELMEGFDDFLKAVFDVANALESVD